MKIDIRQVPDEGLSFKETYHPENLDLQAEGIRFIHPIEADFFITKGINVLSVKVSLAAEAELTCDRCLESIIKPLKRLFNFNYSLEKGQFTVTVDEDIRQELVLTYPAKILCKDDCLGLCPVCGENLNKGKCRCSKERGRHA